MTQVPQSLPWSRQLARMRGRVATLRAGEKHAVSKTFQLGFLAPKNATASRISDSQLSVCRAGHDAQFNVHSPPEGAGSRCHFASRVRLCTESWTASSCDKVHANPLHFGKNRNHWISPGWVEQTTPEKSGQNRKGQLGGGSQAQSIQQCKGPSTRLVLIRSHLRPTN